jgi:hypothetical protein
MSSPTAGREEREAQYREKSGELERRADDANQMPVVFLCHNCRSRAGKRDR